MVQGIGERLKQLRKASHLSQRELSGKLGMSQSLLSSLENNKLDLSLDTFLRVCQFFDVSSEWLLYGKGKPMKRSEAAGMMPLIDQRASAGYVKEGTEVSDEIAYYSIPGFNSKTESRLFEVKGDQMHPTLEEGDLVVTEKLNGMEDVGEGALVVIVTRKDILISRLFLPLELTGEHVVKYDNDHYRDQTISKEEAHEVWQVKSKITSSFVHSSHLQSQRLKRLEREMSRMKKQFEQLSR